MNENNGDMRMSTGTLAAIGGLIFSGILLLIFLLAIFYPQIFPVAENSTSQRLSRIEPKLNSVLEVTCDVLTEITKGQALDARTRDTLVNECADEIQGR